MEPLNEIFAFVGGYDKDPSSTVVQSQTRTLELVIEKVKTKEIKKAIVLSGAGISVSAGIPDFRSPKTGLYANLQKFNLPYAEAVFDIEFFIENPKPFFQLARELWPGNYRPTRTHYFIRAFQENALLVRNYTQNIDGLERLAGIEEDLIIEAHGSFATARCIVCRRKYPGEYVKTALLEEKVEIVQCISCSNGFVKPDIVFFGESLPPRFSTFQRSDFKDCDLLIVMGTSLKVYPFAGLVDLVPRSCHRILINREPSGPFEDLFGSGFSRELCNDVFLQGDCDEVTSVLADAFGWKHQLNKIMGKL